MKSYVALLRGINVGGKNSLPMAELVSMLEALGAKEVKTYIQSGNAVFRGTAELKKKIQQKLPAEISKHKGFDIQLMVMDADKYAGIIAANPYAVIPEAGSIVHVGFLAEAPNKPDMEKLEKLKTGSEQFHLAADAFYLHAPDGFGKSKLANGAEKALGVPMTIRNWKTVCKIDELAKQVK